MSPFKKQTLVFVVVNVVTTQETDGSAITRSRKTLYGARIGFNHLSRVEESTKA